MKYSFSSVLLLLLIIISCTTNNNSELRPNQQDTNKNNETAINVLKADSVEEIILADTFCYPISDLTITPLKLSFKKIDSTEFYRYKNIYDTKITIDTTKNVAPNGGTFSIYTNVGNLQFGCGTNYERPCYNYSGFLVPINAYLIGQWGESIYDLFLVDKRNASRLSLISAFDGGSGLPLISPANTKLITCSSVDLVAFKNYYDIRSNIIMYDLTNLNYLNEINACFEFNTKNWELIDLAWVNEETFVLRVCDEQKGVKNSKPTYMNERFLKATIN
ncbi:MAG: hypothetical protein AB7O47_13465 [Flavobacteriales bacterium]